MFETVGGSPLLVIGAAAREGAALAQLIGTLHARFPALIVIAQQPDPARSGAEGERWARDLPLPVVPVMDHASLQAGTVYLVPAHRLVQIIRRESVAGPEGTRSPALYLQLTADPLAEQDDETALPTLLIPPADLTTRRARPALERAPAPPEEELTTANAAVAGPRAALPHPTMTPEAVQHRLLHGVIQAQENERRRVARELHDDIGQSLTALVLALGVIQDGLPDAAARERQILEDATALAENMMGGLRRVIADLRPPVLDDLGLVPALRRLGSDLEERAGVAVTIQAEEPAVRLPPAMELTLFRVAQEALANIGKHAQAQEARILLRRAPGQVILRIQDDGQGLPEGAASPQEAAARGTDHFGLLGMRERVALLHGSFQLESAPHQGTTVTVVLPLGAA